jgi:hypothetical protein
MPVPGAAAPGTGMAACDAFSPASATSGDGGPETGGEEGGVADGGSTKADASSSPSDAASTTDGAAEAGTPATYFSISDTGKWESTDLNQLTSVQMQTPGGLMGGAFDGKYVYFAPNAGGPFVRYDPAQSFNSAGGWLSKAITLSGVQFEGAAFDGRYITYAPYNYSSQTYTRSSYVQRFDIQGSFADAGAWSYYDVGSTAQGAGGFFGVIRGDQALYFAPALGVFFYEVPLKGALDAGVVFDAGVYNGSQVGNQFVGGVASGGYVYFTLYSSNLQSTGVIIRRKEGVPIDAPNAYEAFDYAAATSDPALKGFQGAVTDGRYVYFVPYGSNILRYDTTKAFNSTSSYRVFQLGAVPGIGGVKSNFAGGAFDGRYVYFSPRQGTSVIRVDSLGDFEDPASWSAYDVKSTVSSLDALGGAVFDGEYIYFTSSDSTIVLKFHARTPSSPPVVNPSSP